MEALIQKKKQEVIGALMMTRSQGKEIKSYIFIPDS